MTHVLLNLYHHVRRVVHDEILRSSICARPIDCRTTLSLYSITCFECTQKTSFASLPSFKHLRYVVRESVRTYPSPYTCTRKLVPPIRRKRRQCPSQHTRHWHVPHRRLNVHPRPRPSGEHCPLPQRSPLVICLWESSSSISSMCPRVAVFSLKKKHMISKTSVHSDSTTSCLLLFLSSQRSRRWYWFSRVHYYYDVYSTIFSLLEYATRIAPAVTHIIFTSFSFSHDLTHCSHDFFLSVFFHVMRHCCTAQLRWELP